MLAQSITSRWIIFLKVFKSLNNPFSQNMWNIWCRASVCFMNNIFLRFVIFIISFIVFCSLSQLAIEKGAGLAVRMWYLIWTWKFLNFRQSLNEVGTNTWKLSNSLNSGILWSTFGCKFHNFRLQNFHVFSLSCFWTRKYS